MKRRGVLGAALGSSFGSSLGGSFGSSLGGSVGGAVGGAVGASIAGSMGATLLTGCAPQGTADALAGVPVDWVGAAAERGHRLRTPRSGAWPTPALQRRCDVLVVGGGLAGLAAARALRRAGIDDVAVLELEDQAGGNSRGGSLAGHRCPLGAHYLPVPDPALAHEVAEWLHEIGLLHTALGRTRPDERHLCHSPQERLFFEGGWIEGVLPPAEPGSRTLEAYRTFGAAVERVRRQLAFAMPSHRAAWTAGHDALDRETFAHWLAREGLDEPRLRWYLDYACRDDYGAGADTVSAWAGLHYFASRHGFHAGGDEPAELDPVFTWPEGNGWLADRLTAPLGQRLQTGRVVLQIDNRARTGVHALAWSAQQDALEGWSARALVLAVPLFVAARLLQAPPPALAEAARSQPHAPWLVANLHLREPLLDRGIGAAPAWDNVAYGSASLGYVDAGHQRLDPRPGPTVLTSYWALPVQQRAALLTTSARAMAQRVVGELQPLHPDLPAKLTRVALMRYGHAMAIPVPGQRSSPALAALLPAGQPAGPLQFAHADLSAYSVFEEAFTHGDRAGQAVAAWLRRR